MAEMVEDRIKAAPGDRQAPPSEPPHGPRSTATRIVLGILTTFVSVNLWTGGPLFALWVGSRIQAASGQITMGAIGATVGVLIVVTFLLYRMLAWLNARYNAAVGRTASRQQSAWLKPMSGERRSLQKQRPASAVERIVVISVVVAVEVWVVWFFFFAHYTL